MNIKRDLNFRGGVSVVTEKVRETQSHLIVQSDEGNYTCKPFFFETASVRLYVLDGKLYIFFISL